MTWISELSSALGIPAGGATAATAVYLGAIAAEREARREALRDIASVIRDPAWSQRMIHPAVTIQRLFNYTFGEKHLSWICVRRSIYASMAFILSFGLQFSLTTHIWTRGYNTPADIVTLVSGALGMGFVTDYVALWKTRLLLNISRKYETLLPVAVVADIIGSVFMIFAMVYALDVASFLIIEQRIFGFGNYVDSIKGLLADDILPVFTHKTTLLPVIGI